MDYESLSINAHNSIVKFKEKTILVSDTTIQSKVGNATYRLLYFNCPSLYAKFYSCNKNKWKESCRIGTGTSVNDFPTWFIDNDYTPKKLKEDIIRIIIGLEPLNDDVKSLFGSSVYDESENICGFDWIIFIFIVIIISMSITWFVLIKYHGGNFKLDICRKNNPRYDLFI